MRKTLALSLMLTVAGGTAGLAAEEAAPAKGAPGNSVDWRTPIVAPVVIDGKLGGYIYISIRLVAASANDTQLITEKRAFIQDAFIREVNARPIQVKEVEKIDRAALGKRFVADAQKIVGSGRITGIIFGDGTPKDIGLKFSGLRPEAAPSEVPFEDAPLAKAKPAQTATHH